MLLREPLNGLLAGARQQIEAPVRLRFVGDGEDGSVREVPRLLQSQVVEGHSVEAPAAQATSQMSDSESERAWLAVGQQAFIDNIEAL